MNISSLTRDDLPYSWKEGNPVPIEDLRRVEVNFWGFDDQPHVGELVVHKKVAQEIVDIFAEVFSANYPIEKMESIDRYEGNDDKSMAANNSSAFCARVITGVVDTRKVETISSLSEEAILTLLETTSKHSLGMAVDVNPKINPYHKKEVVLPKGSDVYLDRSLNEKGMIKQGDALWSAFTARGWVWAGGGQDSAWGKNYDDFHHFELPPKRIVSILTEKE